MNRKTAVLQGHRTGDKCLRIGQQPIGPGWPKGAGLLGLLLLLSTTGRAQPVGVVGGPPPGHAPLTLPECIALAQARNVAAQRADLNTTASRAALLQFRANRYPTLNGNSGYNYSAGRSVDPGTNQFVNQHVGSVSASLTSAVTVFNGGRIQHTIRQYEKDLAATRLDAETARLDLALQVLQGYVAVLQAQEQLQTALVQHAETAAQLARTRQLLAAGSVPETSVLQVQAQLATDQLTATAAANALATALLTLRQLVEEPARPDFAIALPTQPVPLGADTLSPGALYDTALGTQPQVRGASLRAESAGLGVRAARSQLLPRLALSGSLATTYSSARNLYTYQTVTQQQVVGYLGNDLAQPVYAGVPITTGTSGGYTLGSQFHDNFNPSVGLSLSVPILNNLAVRRTIQVAEIAVASAALDERDTRNQLRKAVEQAQNDGQAAGRRAAAAREARRFQDQAYRNMAVKYRLGAANAQDLLIEKNKLASAQSEQTQAKYNYLLALKVLDFYLGKPLTL
ncbi:TolC family protein [Hymenobacter caeli]|uniref:Outer membrane protein n=1 Tax=Hymenobacter caeli TaxID=2735894 RepID=A0ABX2FQZ2_9BACT|nr:TolC family protein [Hymenobacter caeli]NRT19602.1 outer membrane protein [Hymenobacter caeli]